MRETAEKTSQVWKPGRSGSQELELIDGMEGSHISGQMRVLNAEVNIPQNKGVEVREFVENPNQMGGSLDSSAHHIVIRNFGICIEKVQFLRKRA